jgi:hypothetical protein
MTTTMIIRSPPRPSSIASTRWSPRRSGSPKLVMPTLCCRPQHGLAILPPDTDVWKYCNISRSKAMIGQPRRLNWPPKVDTCYCCNGCENRMISGVSVLGMQRLAAWRPEMDTSISCSGREPMGAIGTNGLARLRPKMDTFRSCSGREPMGAIGTHGLARRRPKMDTFISCSGREPMGANGTQRLVRGRP